ncbi:Pre-rRNA-processing protein TSR2-like protein [Entamoeba marina]
MQPWAGKPVELGIFEQSVRGVMNCWSALRICVENEFGGPQSEQLKNSMVNSLLQKYRAKGNAINPSTIVNFLYDFFDNKMCTQCEDNSIEDVAELINRLCAECIVGELALASLIIEDSKKPLEAPGIEQYIKDCEDDGDVSSGEDFEDDSDEDDFEDDSDDDDDGEDDSDEDDDDYEEEFEDDSDNDEEEDSD